MPKFSVFEWPTARGWLVLAPGAEGSSDMRALAITRSAAGGTLACALVNGDSRAGDLLLEDLEELGAPTGYQVDLVSEDDQTIQDRLSDATLVIVEAAKTLDAAQSVLPGAAIRGIRTAYESGALVLVEGLSALLWARYFIDASGGLSEGFSWLNALFMLPTASGVAQIAGQVLKAHHDAYAVGIGAETALALGPNGEVEIWGNRQIAIALSSQFSDAA